LKLLRKTKKQPSRPPSPQLLPKRDLKETKNKLLWNPTSNRKESKENASKKKLTQKQKKSVSSPKKRPVKLKRKKRPLERKPLLSRD
jgi:hypothetical protein